MPTTSAARSPISASATRSRSTTTTSCGARSTTITGRRITSSMPAGGSATTISARAITRCPSASSASCWPRPAMRRRTSTWERRLPSGAEAAPALGELESPETYIGYARADRFVSPGGLGRDEPKTYAAAPLALNDWSLEGAWHGQQAERAVARARSEDQLPLPRPRPPPGARLGDRQAGAFPGDARRPGAGRRRRRRCRARTEWAW